MRDVPIRYEVQDRVATITIDRPEKRNAMTYAVLREFTEAIWRASDDEDARAVIITGAGGAFCAGTDLSELDETPESERGSAARIDDARARLPWPIVQCPKPVIAAIDGAAVGMGIGFVSQVVEPEVLLDGARVEAERYLTASPFAIARTKRIAYEAMAAPVDEHVARTGRLLQECFGSADHAEGVAAFLERRPAEFTGR